MVPAASPRDSVGSEDVPVLEWSQLSGKVKIGEGLFSHVYRSSLTLPGGGKVSVALKEYTKEASKNTEVRNEALFLRRSEGVLGVPKVYGILKDPQVALVMSLCPGRPLKTWRNAEGAPVYLRTLIKICRIVSDLHERGIIHRDLHDKNIIVDATDSGEVRFVSIVDFGLASLSTGDEKDCIDARQIARMTEVVLTEVTEASGPDFSERCQQLYELMDGYITLSQVLTILSDILRDHFLPVESE